MELLEAIRGRRSIRKFLPDPVNPADLREIIEAGILAPSAENDQMWHFVAVSNKELIKKIAATVSRKVDALDNACRTFGHEELAHHKYFLVFFQDAPAIIAVFSRPYTTVYDRALEVISTELKFKSQADAVQQSIGAAIQNISLAAHAKGYGTTWMFGPVIASREIAQLLAVPEPWELSALLPVGKPAHQPKARPRKPLDQVFTLLD